MMRQFIGILALALLATVGGRVGRLSADDFFYPGSSQGCPTGPDSIGGCGGCPSCSSSYSGWFAAQEYLHVRTHFSEGLGFARVSDSMVGGVINRRVGTDELDFDYESSFRSTLGYHWSEYTDIRFNYWRLDVDTSVGGTAGAGETIVDPFGGYARTGSDIAAMAAVQMNVYDLEIVRPLTFERPNLGVEYSAGLRVADVEQAYDSVIRNAGVITSSGVFSADFLGMGPYLTLAGTISPARFDRLSLRAKMGTALLVGQYDVSSELTIPGVVVGGQSADRKRMVPVTEIELGGQWIATDRLTFSAGWLFQSWWNIGASGGTFDGEQPPVSADAAFVGTDDADIMSFDGLFLRGELDF